MDHDFWDLTRGSRDTSLRRVLDGDLSIHNRQIVGDVGADTVLDDRGDGLAPPNALT
jgi:hypothetical protein